MTGTSTAAPDLRGKTVWAIDTLSRVYQLFHALPEMAAPDGTPVSAVFGLTRDLLDIVEKRRPDYLFCAIDPPGPTFRHERFAEYKANRAEMPADLVPQIPLVRRLLAVMGIPCLEAPGFEADDVLATLATRTSAGGGVCVIATSDKDARQLLSDSVRLLNLRTNTAFGAVELVREWGIRPDQVVDFLSLVGDSVDNVPGVPGIGPKIAAELLQRHGTLDAILGRLDDVAGTKRRESLASYADQARRGRELIRLDTAVPIEIPWTAGMRHDPEPESLAEFLRAMGFRSLLSRVKSAAPKPPRGGARGPLLFDIDGPPVEAPAVAMPADEAALVVAVTPLRPPLTICVVPAPGGSRRCRPAGLAVSTDTATVWIGAALAAASNALRGILADPSVPKQGHDLKRQDVALRTLGLRLAGLACDTMLASYLLESGERNLGLVETCVRQGVDVPAAGPEAAALENPTTADEAAVHCRAVRLLAGRMPGLLDEAGLGTLYRDIELPLASLLADMESRGVRIDGDALSRLSADYAARLADLERDIHALAGRPFSIASPVQVRGVLFDELGLPVVKRTKTGPSTDSEVLEELAPLHPLPAKLLEHRKFAKLKSTYVDALPSLVDPVSGRVHTTFNQAATATGRLSSSDPNLQNIPIRTAEGQQIREAFLPGDPDWRFVAADYSQIELRILAHLSGDDAMRRAFAGGEDIHTRTAAAVYGVSVADVTGAMRRTAKAVNFGILYGQSAFGLSKALGISLDQAAGFIASYFETFAGAAAFIDRVLDGCRLEGRVTTMLGRRRQIAGVRDRDRRRAASGGFSLTLPERTAVNTVVQGSAADLIKLAMLRVAARLVAEGFRAALVLQIHDELLLECPAAETERVGGLVEEEMREAMRLDVPLEVSVHAGGTWAACHA